MQGAISVGTSYGMGQLSDWMQGAPEGTANASQIAGQYSIADPNMMSGFPNDPLTQWAKSDLLKRINIMQGRGF